MFAAVCMMCMRIERYGLAKWMDFPDHLQLHADNIHLQAAKGLRQDDDQDVLNDLKLSDSWVDEMDESEGADEEHQSQPDNELRTSQLSPVEDEATHA